MNTEIEQILNEAKSLSGHLMKKGWDGAFTTNGGYPDDVLPSLERYLYQSMLGNEKGIGQGLTLSTYARYTNEQRVTCDFTVSLGAGNKLQVRTMVIKNLDSHNQQVAAKTLLITEQSQILTSYQAIEQVSGKLAPRHSKSVGRYRRKW